MGKTRNSSIEVLRIISMLMIVCSHFCTHGGFDTSAMELSLNKIILQVGTLGNLGVALFVMISGYFLSQTAFKLSRIVKIIFQVAFFSVSIYFILCALNLIDFSVKSAVKALFPILFDQYWFATTYVVFALLSPFLNRLLYSFTRNQYLIFLGALLLVWSVIPTFTSQKLGSNEFCLFVMYYSIGAFVRKYPDIPLAVKLRYWITASSALLLVMSTVAFNILAVKMPVFDRGTYFYSKRSVLILALAYGLLMIFTNLKPGSSRIVNMISSTTFGVYLIHDNIYMRDLIWKDILGVNEYQNSAYLPLYLIGCVAAVFLSCSIIDHVRQKLFERPIMHLLERPLNRLSEKASAICCDKNNEIK